MPYHTLPPAPFVTYRRLPSVYHPPPRNCISVPPSLSLFAFLPLPSLAHAHASRPCAGPFCLCALLCFLCPCPCPCLLTFCHLSCSLFFLFLFFSSFFFRLWFLLLFPSLLFLLFDWIRVRASSLQPAWVRVGVCCFWAALLLFLAPRARGPGHARPSAALCTRACVARGSEQEGRAK